MKEDIYHQDDVISHIHQFDKLPKTTISRFIRKIIQALGYISSWIWPILMMIIVINVTMRYYFHDGRIELEELQWHLYSVGWLLGLSYAFTHDRHVRVDIFHEKFSLKTRSIIELLGLMFFLMPFTIMVIWYAIPFITYSFEVQEISPAPGGLTHRWIIKAMLLVGFVFLFLSCISRLSRLIAYFINKNLTSDNKNNH